MENTRPFEKREKEGGLTQKITRAIQSDDADKVVAALQDANEALTGEKRGSFAPGEYRIKKMKEQIAEFLEDAEGSGMADTVIYLGDGGFSRLIILVIEGKITVDLTEGSSSKAKKAWDELK